MTKKINFNVERDGPDMEAEFDILMEFHKKLYNDIETANKKEYTSDLTEDEKFALAYSAGVSIESIMNDGKFKFRSEPCGLYKHNGEWRVVTKSNL